LNTVKKVNGDAGNATRGEKSPQVVRGAVLKKNPRGLSKDPREIGEKGAPSLRKGPPKKEKKQQKNNGEKGIEGSRQ